MHTEDSWWWGIFHHSVDARFNTIKLNFIDLKELKL